MTRNLTLYILAIVSMFAVSGCKLIQMRPNEPLEHQADDSSESGAPTDERYDALSKEELVEKIKAFCRAGFQREVTDGHLSGKLPESPSSPVSQQVYDFRDVASGEDVCVTIAPSTGIVTSYYVESSNRSRRSAEKGMPQSVSEGQAFEAAKPVLRWYGLPLEREQYDIRPDKGTLPPQFLRIARQHSFQGVPCRARGVSVVVSMFEPTVSWVSYDPVTIPEEDFISVSQEEALGTATEWMGRIREFQKDGVGYVFTKNLEQIKKVITPPLNIPIRGEKQPQDNGFRLDKTYYAWSVPVTFSVNGRKVKWFVYVDTKTGKIITCGDNKRQ
jgi:hypothetical protein